MALDTQTSLGAHRFDGPYTHTSQLPAASGVYLITTLPHIGPTNQYTIIDVGESGNIQNRIANHDRSPQWKSHEQNGVHAWVLLGTEAQRMLIERAHRIAYNPICGNR